MKHYPQIFAALMLASCGPGENEPGPGGVTVGEAKALDDAAAMLDARRSPAETATKVRAPLPPALPSSRAER
ncbi:MAG: hypothetical protein Q8R44_02610 [Novosphingobium sp.]|nr:hypothetical protein [Novosphingobium sp.]